MKSKQKSLNTRIITGFFAFLVTCAVTVTAAVLIFSAVDPKNTALQAVVMAGCILVIAVIFTSVDWIRKKFTIDQPLSEILDGTEKISEGDFSVSFKPKHRYGKYNEFDKIMDNLNIVAAELSKTEMLRNDFISNVSHEIKTPLAIVENYAALLKNDALKEEERAQYVDTIITAAKRLNMLVVNILKLNKLENQTIFADKTEVDVSESLTEVIFGFDSAIEKKHIDMDCDIEESVKIVSDQSFLEIIWTNLLSNAIKFTPEGGKIAVSLKKEPRFVTVKVCDSGQGISNETGAHIFDKFYQGDSSHAEEGNGLGLALVKRVLDLIGGEISVDSTIGKGSTFAVKLRDSE